MDAATAYRRRWWTLGVLSLSLTVIGLDHTILNVALPTLVKDLGATSSQLQWIVDSYVLVFAGLLLSAGALGDRFGRKLALVVGMVVFLAASVASAFAGDAGTLVATRALMGVGGALIMPSTLSIITNVFPAEERGKAISVWAGVAGLGIVIGPTAGGWLLEHFWWGAVFIVNVPLILAGLLASPLVPESKDPEAARLDPVGALLSIAGLSTLVYGLIEAPNLGWTAPTTLAAFGVALALLALFVGWELRTPHPMLQMGFFRNPRFTAASLAITLVFFAMFGTVFLNTQYLQLVLGYGPLEAGVRVLPIAAMVPFARASEVFVRRVGTKLVVGTGLLVAASSMALMSTLQADSGYGLVAWTLGLLGAGMGLVMAPATESIMGSLPPAKAGVGSAMNDTTRMVGGALGVAVIGSVMSSGYGAGVAPLLGGLPAPAGAAVEGSLGGALAVAAQLPAQAGAALRQVAVAAFVDGMGDGLIVAAAVAVLGALVAFGFLPARAGDETGAGEVPQPETAAV